MNRLWMVTVLAAMACGGKDAASTDPDAAVGGAMDGAVGDDAHVQDPADPVEDVPAHTGIYTFGKLTTDDFLSASSGTWFNDDVTQHKVTDTRVTYARYRDGMVLQSKIASQILIYDQATTTVSAPIALPSDAIGRAAIRGGLVFIGGTSKVYSYEIATQMWRMRMIPGTGACHHVTAGLTRLFAICANPTTPANDDLFSMWASKAMSDVVPIGTVTPGKGASTGWITVAPGSDTAYFGSRTQDLGCVGRATWNALEPCVFSLRTLTTNTDASVFNGQMSEDGKLLYVTFWKQSDTDVHLYEIDLAAPMARSIRTIDSYATCPDNSVVFQDGTISQRRAGGVTTDVRLGFGGEADMGCPLVKQ